MAPGVDGLPPAAGPRRAGSEDPDGAIDTVAPIERYLASVPHRAVRQVKVALWALELLPFPWRFSRASVDARQGFLERFEGSRLPFASDLLLFLKVLAGLGYGNDSRVRAAVEYTAGEIERIARVAFDAARRRGGTDPPRVTSV